MKNNGMKMAVSAVSALALVAGALPTALAANAAGEKVTLSSVNVAIDDSISLRFYATKASVDAANVASVSLDGPNADPSVAKEAFESATISGTDYYVFTYPLYATQLDENVTIQFLDGSNAVVAIEDKGNSYSYNVNTYCDYVIADADDEFDEKTEKAVKSLKNLGIASDNYFDNTSTAISFMEESYDGLSYCDPSFATDTKISLVLDSKLAARIYIDGLTADSKTDANVSAVKGNYEGYCFEAKSINPAQLGKAQTITYGGADYTFSALSYCARAISSENAKAVDAAKTVYEYYKYITEYAATKTVTVNGTSFSYVEGMTWNELAASLNKDLELGCAYGMVWYMDTQSVYYYNAENDIVSVAPDDVIIEGVAYSASSQTE